MPGFLGTYVQVNEHTKGHIDSRSAVRSPWLRTAEFGGDFKLQRRRLLV